MSFDPVEDKIVPKPIRIAGRVIKYVFLSAVAIMIVWLSIRSCYQDGTPKMKKYMWTENAVEMSNSGTLTVKRLTEYQDPKLSTLFFISRIYYTEEIDQLQFMIRYNTLNQEYKDMLDENGKASFVFELTDGEGTHYTKYQYITDSALMYKYYRIAFEDVDLSYVSKLNVKIYLVTDNGDIYVGSCIVWEEDVPMQDHDPGKGNKANSEIKHGEKTE